MKRAGSERRRSLRSSAELEAGTPATQLARQAWGAREHDLGLARALEQFGSIARVTT